MDREKCGILILWIVVVGLIIWAIYQTLTALADYAPAIIAAIAIIYVALLNHSLSQQREIKLQQQKEKQKNYEKLLGVAADFIRDPNNKDIWDTVHLYSWVVGSEGVIRGTQEFTDKRNEKTLKALLEEMRKDIGLENTSQDLMPKVFRKKNEGYVESDESAGEQLTSSSSGRQKRRFWPR